MEAAKTLKQAIKEAETEVETLKRVDKEQTTQGSKVRQEAKRLEVVLDNVVLEQAEILKKAQLEEVSLSKNARPLDLLIDRVILRARCSLGGLNASPHWTVVMAVPALLPPSLLLAMIKPASFWGLPCTKTSQL